MKRDDLEAALAAVTADSAKEAFARVTALLRRERDRIQGRLSSVRSERDELAAQDEDALRGRAEEATLARDSAEQRLAACESALEAASAARSGAAAAERSATDEEAEVNRLWREASTELDRLRETYEDEDRARGDLERRIRDAERLLREGHQREPEEALTELEEDDAVPALERKAVAEAHDLHGVVLAVEELLAVAIPLRLESTVGRDLRGRSGRSKSSPGSVVTPASRSGRDRPCAVRARPFD